MSVLWAAQGMSRSLMLFLFVLVVLALGVVVSEALRLTIRSLPDLGKVRSVILIVEVFCVVSEAFKDALVTVELASDFSSSCGIHHLIRLRSLEIDCAIIDLSLLWMGLFLNLTILNRLDREEITRHIVLDSNVRCMLHLLEVLQTALFDEVQVFARVLRLGLRRLEVQCVLWAVEFIVVIYRQVVVQLVVIDA